MDSIRGPPLSQQKNRTALEDLQLLERRFQLQLKRAEETARFKRSADRSAEFVGQMRQAKSYLELALHALVGEEPESSDGSGGWLATRVGGLVRYLTKDDAPAKPLSGAGPTNAKAPETRTSLEETDAEGALVGDCACMPVPDLLAMLQGQGKTGVLRVTHEDETFVLHLSEGQLVHAFSEKTPVGERLGEILIRRGALTHERLASVLYCNSSIPRKIGDVLIDGDVVSREELEDALTEQVQGLFDRLFVVEGARFRFEPGLPKVEENRARLNLMQLLLESARHQDERLAG